MTLSLFRKFPAYINIRIIEFYKHQRCIQQYTGLGARAKPVPDLIAITH
jgi:hypothetical protein